ncbi:MULTISPECIES: hypothetical protein [unclassified Curtobacterium]|uniref:hypothetical protein n=1 Tax=unclassified Curtobacterium TaxID=257496 RepID=UPI0008DD4BF6|nr:MULTISPECIES: hypothetical protein [unclassified Curtobacterium]OIH96784.1 hypothetical protein BIU92_03395 [Curtobacterium sp. MCBA15_003]OII09282.1 hypothetical protein BIU97_12125 [Curtobacterium sp. MCBA15_009]OII29153.1 hypothetical protein BIU94_13775 [Curtobacterium sp. MMLR14_006]WIE65789.1 hypothetical protein DEI99_004415 [Curtobacterium sp. MCLR17_036]
MATYEVQAVRERGAWQVFIDGFMVTEVSRWPSVGFVARELLAMDRDDELHISVVGRNQYVA